MDPFTILSTLQALVGCVQWTFDAIQKVKQAEADEKDALKKLKATMSDVKTDISVFDTVVSVLQSPENKHFYSVFMEKQSAKDAMTELGQALHEIAIQLEAQGEPGKSPSTSKPARLRPVLELIILLPCTERKSTITDLNNITSNLLDNRRKAKRAFKLVWALYALSQPSPPIDPKSTSTGDSARALDTIHLEFIRNPFAISPAHSNSHAPFSVLNSDKTIATSNHKLAKRLGKQWIDEYIDSRKASSSQLVEAQITLFKCIRNGTIEHLKTNPTHDADDREHIDFQQTLNELDRSLQEVIARSTRPKFAISFYGMVKAGKSSFLNAMIGKVVLPSDELPSTAWPCRLVHVKGEMQPSLQVRTEPFDRAIQILREHGYASKMRNYKPQSDTILDAMVQGYDSEAPAMLDVYHEWMSLHGATRDNLVKFEEASFKLPAQVSGVKDVKDLLGKINDIVRLCKRFGFGFDGTEDHWPTLRIEFSSLKDRDSNGAFEFIDLPGIGEQFRDSNWEPMVLLAASQSSAIVPVMSIMELSRKDWRDLPNLAASGYKRKPTLAVCTHLDQASESSLEQKRFIVSKTFWPESAYDSDRVLVCSSIIGLSASQLLEKSETAKPPFKDIWELKSIGHHCALKILGEGEPEATYERWDRETWRSQIEKQLKKSGIPDVIQRLTREMVDNVQENALLSENDEAFHRLRGLRRRVGRKLLEARRTQDEFESAKGEYEKTCQRLRMVLNTWVREEQEQKKLCRQQLEAAYKSLNAHTLIQRALQTALQSWEMAFQGPSFMMDGDRPLFYDDLESPIQTDVELTDRVLQLKSKPYAEEFLRWSYQALLGELRRFKTRYVNVIRGHGEDAKSSRINALQKELQTSDGLQTEFRDDIIAELESQSIDIRELVYSQIKREIKISSTRYTAKTAFQTIETNLARWWFNSTPENERKPQGKPPSSITRDSSQMSDGSPTLFRLQDDEKVEEAVRSSVERLGFMLRAPLTVATSITWTVGAPIWVFMPQSLTYHLPMKTVQQRYDDEIVKPWLKQLSDEGEKTLLGIIDIISKAVKGTLDSALEREEIRYAREMETKKKPLDSAAVDNLVTAFMNLLAAEKALKELNGRISKK